MMKKSASIIIFLTIFILCVTNSYSQTYGDANTDGSVDIIDALLIAQYFVGLDPEGVDTSTMDVNADDSIDIVDALLVAQYYTGLIDEFPITTITPAPTELIATPVPTGIVTAAGGTQFPTGTPGITAQPGDPTPTPWPPEPTPDPTTIPAPTPTPMPVTFEINIDNTYRVYRTGPLDADVRFFIEENGEQKAAINGKYSLDLTYLNYIPGKNYRLWLESYSDSQYYCVSNIIEFTYDETLNYQLTVDSDYQLHRSGIIGDEINWVIEKDGTIILERDASNELEYLYYNNTSGSYIRAWLHQFISGEYHRVSNYIEYSVSVPINYTIILDQSHRAVRNGYTGIPVNWVLSKNGNLFTRYLLNDSLQCIEYDHEQDAVYEIWLETEAGELVSNTLSYYVDEIIPEYSLTINNDGILYRDGAAAANNLSWSIEKDGLIVMQANAMETFSYNYFENVEFDPDSHYRMWLVQFIDGGYQRVSNIVFY